MANDLARVIPVPFVQTNALSVLEDKFREDGRNVKRCASFVFPGRDLFLYVTYAMNGCVMLPDVAFIFFPCLRLRCAL